MNLYELAVRILCALLVARGDCTARADHRVRRLAEDETRTTSSDDYRVGGKRFELECLKVHRDQSTTNLMIVEDQRQHLPMFELPHLAVNFIAPHLFVQRIKKLLARRSSCESSAVMF